MAQCKLTAHEFIQNTFSPMVAVMCSPLVNQVCQKNNLSFIEMVQPFCKLNTEAYIRDPSGSPVQVRNLRILMQDITARPPEPLLARKFLNESVSQSFNERSSPFQIGANENIEIPSSVPWFDAWRETFLQVQFPSDHEFTKHYIACILVVSSSESNPAETLQHMGYELQQLQNVAPAKLPKWFCSGALRYYVLVHDAADCDGSKAEAIFGSMKAVHGDANCYFMPINSRPVGCGEEQSHLPDPWSQFLLRHADNLESSDHDSSPRTPVDTSTVGGMPNSIKVEGVSDGEMYEVSNSMLQMGSVKMSSLEMGQEAGESTPIAVVHHPLSPDCGQAPSKEKEQVVANNVNSITNHINANVWVGQASRVQTTSHHGGCLTAGDLERLRTFIQDFCVKALLPYVEQQIQQFSDIISNKKGVSRSLFSATKRWFGSNKPGMPGVNTAANAVIYTNDAPELQLRRLGDLCFMFGLYALAFQAYHSAKRDFNTDQAWLYYAGALEMASLAAFMQGEITKKTQDYMEESIITYLNSCRMPQFATRATLLSTECLKARNLHTESARQFIRMTSEDSDLRSALLLEQASYCFLKSVRPRMVRKYAFHIVLAGHRFSKAGQRKHSQRCYKQALQVFENKNWGLAEDHIHYTIGRTASHLKQVSEAALSFSLLLYAGSSQPAVQQAAFLREYLTAQLQLSDDSCTDGNVLPVLPLPVIVSNSIRVLVGPIQSHLPHDPTSNKVPASGVTFSDDVSDNSRWNKLEELLVTEAEGALPMIFKPTVHLFTNYTINTSRPIAVVREPVFICATLQNPFHISLMLRNVYLLWEFVSSSVQVDNEMGVEDTSNVVETQILESFVLRPNCVEDVVLCVTPTVVGTLHLKGIAYSIANLVPPVPAEGNVAAASAAPQLVPGKQLFILKLPPVKSKDKAMQELKDMRLELTVVPSAPCLQVMFKDLPTEMLCGELQLVTVEFTNVGNAPLKCLYVSWSLPECFSLDERPMPMSGPQQVTRIPLPEELKPEKTRRAKFWLRAPDVKGTTVVDMMIYYENIPNIPRYRLVRHSWQLSVLSSIEVSVTAKRSCASVQKNSQEFLSLTMSLKNSNQVHDPVMTEITPVQLSLASRTWQLVDKVFIPNETKLQFQESVHFLAKASRKVEKNSSDRFFSDVVITKTNDTKVISVEQSPYTDFYHHHFPVQEVETDGELREESLQNLEAAQCVDVVVILRWQAAVESGGGVRRMVTGQHHVRVERLGLAKTWPESPITSQVQESPGPAQMFTPDLGPPQRSVAGLTHPSLNLLQRLVIYSVQHAPRVGHNFCLSRICVVPIKLSLQNCSDSLLSVKVSTVGNSNMGPIPSKNQLYSPHCSGCFRWVGLACCNLDLLPHASESVDLSVAVGAPGTFNLGAGIEVWCRAHGAAEADSVAQSWRVQSSLIVESEL